MTTKATINTTAMLCVSILCGCASQPLPANSPPSATVRSVRVVSSAPIGVMEGDLELQYFSFVLQASDHSGAPFTAVKVSPTCPLIGDTTAVYDVRLRQERLPFTIRNGEEALRSDLVISDCDRVTSPDYILTGRVISGSEVGFFFGKGYLVWRSLVVQPDDAAIGPQVVITPNGWCPEAEVGPGQYRLQIVRSNAGFVAHAGQENQLFSNIVVGCEKLPGQGAGASARSG